MTEMTRPTFPRCPTCDEAVNGLEGFGERMFVQPCGHAVSATINAGGVSGAVVLRSRIDTPTVQPDS